MIIRIPKIAGLFERAGRLLFIHMMRVVYGHGMF